jgi:sterol desaturase/sphingolipid hydroxylase (fatty acid hydroxylase superfamily)
MLDPTVVAIPMFIGLMTVEAVSFRLAPDDGLRGYQAKDAATSITMGLGSLVVGAVWGLVALACYGWVADLSPLDLGAVASGPVGWTAALAWALLVVMDDLCYYWFHRLHHEVRVFWAAHVTHHSSQYYNLSTAVRQSWTPMTGLPFYLPVFLLGFQPWQWAVVHGFNLLYQFWIHTERIDRLGPLEWVLNTPSHHRVHHGTNRQYLDRNYGGILIVFDRLFGTFEPERERVVYGLTTNITSHNPVYVAWHEFAAIARDVRAAGAWRDRAGYVLGHPGWQPTAPAAAQRVSSTAAAKPAAPTSQP